MTDSERLRILALALRRAGLVIARAVEEAYDLRPPQRERTLADREQRDVTPR